MVETKTLLNSIKKRRDKMIETNPLFIIGMPRSGTSAVAAIFAAHGYWYGKDGITESAGQKYPTYENVRIKKYLRSICNIDPNDGGMSYCPLDFRTKIEQIVKREGYPGGKWMIKCSAVHYPACFIAYPAARVIIVKRPVDQVKKHNVAPKRIARCQEIMNMWGYNYKGHIVRYNKIINHDFSELWPWNIDERLAKQVVNPDWRHYK